MQIAHIWDKFHLHRPKALIILLLLLTFAFTADAQYGQRRRQINNPGYDDKNFSYGFLIGLHTTSYSLKYSDAFLTEEFDSVFSINPKYSPGFSLGFIINFRIEEFFDLRLTPTVSFNEYEVEYRYLDDPAKQELVETTVVELPIMIKYKSERRGNMRMYVLGGVKPGFEASGKNEIENIGEDNLETKVFNMSIDIGAGFDIYYPLFKFSPEIRYSRGLVNMLDDPNNDYGKGIDNLKTNTISVIFHFQ